MGNQQQQAASEHPSVPVPRSPTEPTEQRLRLMELFGDLEAAIRDLVLTEYRNYRATRRPFADFEREVMGTVRAKLMTNQSLGTSPGLCVRSRQMLSCVYASRPRTKEIIRGFSHPDDHYVTDRTPPEPC